CQDGLDVKKLVKTRLPKGEMDPSAFEDNYIARPNTEWLDVECDILVPAALEDVINKDNAHKVKASLICEAANIPVTPEADEILAGKGVDIAVDFIDNMGGIRIYEALVFGIIEPVPEDIVNDTTSIIRKQMKRVFEKAKAEGKTQRQAARELFAPDVFDTPDN
ncbi:MAG: Glu/Leu/Phe/Val dehydrogenase, partial [Desulfobacteraceae bacterium]|nr:Glu/Leu/Phe/Val dehydrogenase [Desulfobacteraceae bacterium]